MAVDYKFDKEARLKGRTVTMKKKLATPQGIDFIEVWYADGTRVSVNSTELAPTKQEILQLIKKHLR